MFACRRCDAEIPGDAGTCPECGYDPAGPVRGVAATLLALGIVLLLAVPPAGVFAIFVGVLLLGWSVMRTPAARVA